MRCKGNVMYIYNILFFKECTNNGSNFLVNTVYTALLIALICLHCIYDRMDILRSVLHYLLIHHPLFKFGRGTKYVQNRGCIGVKVIINKLIDLKVCKVLGFICLFLVI